jgi:hypothetical protein
MTRFLHIVNGSTTQQGLQQAGIPGETSEYADVLHEGPVPPDDDIDAWLSVRAEFIASLEWESAEAALQHMRGWQRALESFRDYDDVVLWYEHDLFDQLLLIRHLHWWWTHAPMDPPSLVSPADYLGGMSSAQLLGLFEAKRRVTEAQLTLASSAWQAFTASEPTELVRIVQHENTSDLPHLQGALLRLLQEYPSTRNGLGRTEQQMLGILEQSPLSAFDLFTANARREERVFMGDATFFTRLDRLLSARRPLVQRRTADGPLELTDHGQRVLAGEADDVELNGVERWIGGVHLTESALWRWNGVSVARVAAP